MIGSSRVVFALVGGGIALLAALSLTVLFLGTFSGPGTAILLLVAFFGTMMGLWVRRLIWTTLAQRRYILKRTLVGLGFGTLIGGLQCVAVVAVIFQQPQKPLSLDPPLMLAGLLCLLGGILGAVAGEWGSNEADILAEMQLPVEQRRTILLEAMINKFGPLSDNRRQAIQDWDPDRIAEARRKLPQAERVEEL